MSDDETYEVALQDQRVFGAGIKRKKVKFVPSSDASSTVLPTSASCAKSVSDFYLSLVLPQDLTADSNTQIPSTNLRPPSQICTICSLPLSESSTDVEVEDIGEKRTTRPHEASLAHQICLEHSHPPSHLDRSRKGLNYLSSYGWDPDSRLGLGASGQGIQFPIKTKPKDDKMGIGLILPKEADRRKKEKPTKLDAGKVRKLHEKDKRKAQALREMFYRSDDLEKYLGAG